MPSHLHIFQKYRSPTFIESGTFKGEGIDLARQAGFRYIHSIEVDPGCYRENLLRFSGKPEVELYCGSSEEFLGAVIKLAERQHGRLPWEPITYWLDGHYSGIDPATGKVTPRSSVNCPLLMELAAIKRSGRTHDIILIDDIRCCSTDLFDGITREQLEAAVLDINPAYRIVYEDSWEPKDIMCCTI